MPLIDDSGRRITNLPATPKPRPSPKKPTSTSTPSYLTNKRYPKPKAAPGLPKWAAQMRANSDFMPLRVKPVSYTALANAEAARGFVHRPAVFAPPNWNAPTTTQTTVSGYYKPTEDVAKGFIQEHNLWQDIKNMGATAVHKGGSLIGNIFNVVSTPLYALENVYKGKLERHYTAADSQGGADVTGWEALKAFAGMASPVGITKDVVSGNLDDVLKSTWKGLTWEDKTTTHDVLSLTNPEFVKEHPNLAIAASLAGDIVFDPLTWFTMGTNPASITKAGGAGLRLLAGDKNAAARLWNETLFTSEGRAAGKAAVKSHYQQQDLGRLGRKETRLTNKLEKAKDKAAKGKDTTARQAALNTRIAEVSSKYAAKAVEDLHGAALAWRLIRKGAPTGFTMPISRFNTGAGASTALRGAKVLTDAHRDFNMSVAEALQSEDRWKSAYVSNQFRDFEYTFAGETHTVKLSEARTLKDFIYMVAAEANPIAEYAEHGKIAGRARGTKIKSTEGRGYAFLQAFKQRYEDDMITALGPETGAKFDKIRGFHQGRAKAAETADTATEADIQNPEYLTLDDNAFNDPDITFDDLKTQARDLWRAVHPTGKYPEERAAVLYKDINGNVKKIHLSALSKLSEDFAKQRITRIEEKLAAEAHNTPEKKAMDRLSGVSDGLAKARAKFEALNLKAQQERDVSVLYAEIDQHEAEAGLAAYSDVNEKLINTMIDANPEFTAAEKAKYRAILADTSLTLPERYAKLMEDVTISNEEAADLVEDAFNVVIDNNGTIHLPKGGSIQDIPKLVRTVLYDRFQHRITAAMKEASGYGVEGDPETGLRLTYEAPAESVADVQYMRDVNGEIGMMLLDGYRAAISYAAQNDLMADPDVLMDTIHETASEFMTMAVADTKSQVFQLIYNTTGMRFPEDLVPTFEQVDNIVRNKTFKFKSMQTGEELKDQETPWIKLTLTLQEKVVELFKPFIDIEKLEGTNEGYNFGPMLEELQRSLHEWREITPPSETMTGNFVEDIDKIRYFEELVDDINGLHNIVEDLKWSGSVNGVNRYSMLDFLLYSKEILAGQGTATHVSSTPQGLFGRVNAGRLSALDSFTFLEEDAIRGLEAIETLKGWVAKTGKTVDANHKEMAHIAQKALADVFLVSGGANHLARITSISSREMSLASTNLKPLFDTLGIHAFLKEASFRKTPFGTGHAMQLNDALWGQATINHELQKAWQNHIIYKVWVEGKTEAQTAEDLEREVKYFFREHDQLKRLLYPVRRDNNELYEPLAMNDTKISLQESFGNNRLDTPWIKPGETRHAPEDYAPKSMLNRKLNYTDKAADIPAPGKKAAFNQAAVDKLKESEIAVAVAREHLQDMIDIVNRVRAGGADDPQLLDDLRVAREEYIQAQKDAAGGSTAPTGAPAANNAADFNNTGNDIEYTDAEVEQIKKYIGVVYNESNPDVLAKQLHAMSIALTGDIFKAQQDMKSMLSDLNLKYGVNAKFMGIPLLPLGGGPGNATKVMAGVVTYEQEKGKATNFLTQVVTQFRNKEKGNEVYTKFSRPSTLFEGGLERIRMGVVNFAGISRKVVIATLEDMYAKALGSDYNLPAFNGMKRRNKLKYIKDALFSPTAKGVPDRINEFNLPDGSNPVRDIEVNFHDSAKVIFVAESVDGRIDELTNFNRYMHKDYRLDDGFLLVVRNRMHLDADFAELMPYSREWLQAIGQMGAAGSRNKLRIERLLKLNLGRFHYAMQDAKLKYQSGRALNTGVFKQFSFKMEPADAAYYNNNIVPNTVDYNGKVMRGPMVPVTLEGIGPATEWGIQARHIPVEFLDKGYYITTDLLPEIRLMFDYIDELGEISDTLTTGYMQQVMGYFKKSVTIYKVPSYPVRNLIGDVLMSAFDGLLNPIYYKHSGQLLWEFSKALAEIDIKDYEGIFDGGMMRREMAKAAHDPSSVLDPSKAPPTPFTLHLVTASGPLKLNGSQIMDLYNTMGLGQNRVSGEIAEALDAARQSGASVAAGKVNDLLRNWNDAREDFARVAHFIYALEREAPLGGDITQVARRAGLRVVKHHFDYNDVSLFERKYLAPYLPFYKWTRNVIPYTLSMMITKPVALKAENALQKTIAFMIDDDEDTQRKDLVIPEWIEYDQAVQIGTFTDPNMNEFGQYMSLSMPLSDTFKRTLGPFFNPMFDDSLSLGQKALDSGAGGISVGMAMLNPVAKGLIQAPTHQELWPTGGAPEKGSWLDTMMTVIPGKAGVETLIKGGTNLKGVHEGNVAAWVLEQAGAINVSNNTERAQLGELNRREDYYRAQLNKQKDVIMGKMKKKWPKLTPEQQKELMDMILKASREGDPDRVR